MKTKSGKDFTISGSEWKDGALIVDYWVNGSYQFYKFMGQSKKRAYALLREKARQGLLD